MADHGADLAWGFSLLLDCLQKGKEPEDSDWDRINAIDAALTRDESSTEGGARPGDSPLNDTRTNSDRPWREDVARAFVTNRPAQPEGAGEARVAWACTNPECSFPSADEAMNCPRCMNMLTRVPEAG